MARTKWTGVALGLLLLAGCDSAEPEEQIGSIPFSTQPKIEIVTASQALISWATQDSLGGEIRFGKDPQALTGSIPVAAHRGPQFIAIPGLEPGSAYYASFSFNDAGRISRSSTIAFRTTDALPRVSFDLEAYQRRIVGVLSGHDTAEGFERLGVRNDPASRARAASYLLSELQSLGPSARLHSYTYTTTGGAVRRGANPYVVIPSTTASDEYVVVGAHYDTVFASPGANDNASGVAVVLGAARDVAALPRRTKNLLVVLFDQEEIGLIGSRQFADSLVAAGTNVHSVHTADQIGWDSDGDRAIELEVPTPALEFLYRASSGETTSAPIHLSLVDATDHRRFRAAGFDAVGLTEEFVSGDTTPHYHKPTDTFETVNFDFLVDTTRMVSYAWKVLMSQ